MSKETYIGGDYIEWTGGKSEEYAKVIRISSNEKNNFTAVNGQTYGEAVVFKSDNGFVPIITIDDDNPGIYKILTEDEYKIWTLDTNIDKDLRTQKSKIIKIISKEKKINITFNVAKGSSTANDNEGNITVEFHKNGSCFEKIIKEDVKYDGTINIEIEKSKKTEKIKFYANDNDIYFDGNISNVFCGAVKIGDCLNELKIETVKSINKLSKEEKAKFMATVLVEAANGKKDLWDIAYIYLNLVNIYGFEDGMSKSSAYLKKQYLYKAHLYNLGYGREYKNVTDGTNFKGKTVAEEADVLNTLQQVTDFEKFCNKNIFIDSPKSKYKDWEGQGYYGDMNIRMHDDRSIWAKASQYFHLQKKCKVKERLVVELRDNSKGYDCTTYIYDKQKIIRYFEENPNDLPEYQDGECLFDKTILKLSQTQKNAIPAIYIIEPCIKK